MTALITEILGFTEMQSLVLNKYYKYFLLKTYFLLCFFTISSSFSCCKNVNMPNVHVPLPVEPSLHKEYIYNKQIQTQPPPTLINRYTHAFHRIALGHIVKLRILYEKLCIELIMKLHLACLHCLVGYVQFAHKYIHKMLQRLSMCMSASTVLVCIIYIYYIVVKSSLHSAYVCHWYWQRYRYIQVDVDGIV